LFRSVGHMVKTHKVTWISHYRQVYVDKTEVTVNTSGNDTLFFQIKKIFKKKFLVKTQVVLGGIVSKSHTHPSHSQTSHLLTSSLSLGVPVPHTTQSRYARRVDRNS
jgi:hypothetical protein